MKSEALGLDDLYPICFSFTLLTWIAFNTNLKMLKKFENIKTFNKDQWGQSGGQKLKFH